MEQIERCGYLRVEGFCDFFIGWIVECFGFCLDNFGVGGGV